MEGERSTYLTNEVSGTLAIVGCSGELEVSSGELTLDVEVYDARQTEAAGGGDEGGYERCAFARPAAVAPRSAPPAAPAPAPAAPAADLGNMDDDIPF